MKKLSLCVLVVASNAGAVLSAPSDASARSSRQAVIARIDDYRHATWRWQSLMGRRRTPTARSEREATGAAYRRWVLTLWKERAEKARRQAAAPPHRSAWLCLQRHEGSWRANTGNGYYGGLQMDLSFQRAYGRDFLRRWGTADRWPPAAQVVVADRAYRAGRGFTPWPNTARACGLL